MAQARSECVRKAFVMPTEHRRGDTQGDRWLHLPLHSWKLAKGRGSGPTQDETLSLGEGVPIGPPWWGREAPSSRLVGRPATADLCPHRPTGDTNSLAGSGQPWKEAALPGHASGRDGQPTRGCLKWPVAVD